MLRRLFSLIAFAALTSLGTTSQAHATLIGDEVRLSFVENGNITFGPAAAIVDDGIEFAPPGGVSFDVSASRVDFLLDSVIVFGEIDYILSDLDWIGQPGEIVDVELTTDVGLDATASFTPDSVTLSITGGGVGQVTIFASIEIITQHAEVPEPGSLALFSAGIGLLGFARHRRARQDGRRKNPGPVTPGSPAQS